MSQTGRLEMGKDEETDVNQNQTTKSASECASTEKSDPLPWLIRNLRQKQASETTVEAEFVASKDAN